MDMAPLFQYFIELYNTELIKKWEMNVNLIVLRTVNLVNHLKWWTKNFNYNGVTLHNSDQNMHQFTQRIGATVEDWQILFYLQRMNAQLVQSTV